MNPSRQLTVRRGPDILFSEVLTRDLLIGRDPECQVRLPERSISRKHLLFRLRDNAVEFEKQSEFASVLINGSDSQRGILKEGDVLSLGPYQISLSLDSKKEKLLGSPGSLGFKNAPDTGEENLLQDPESASQLLDPSSEAVELEENASSEAPEPTGIDLGLDSGNLISDPQLEENGVIASDSEGSLRLEGDFNTNLPDESSPSEGEAPAFEEEPPQDRASESQGGALEIEDASNESSESPNPDPADFFGNLNSEDKTKTAADKLSVHLILPEGSANVTDLELTQPETFLGRGEECQIILNDKKSSRKNSVILRVGGRFTIRDLDSSNGTYVNQVGIKEQILSDGDLIQIGNTEIRFKASSIEYDEKQNEIAPLASLPEEPAEIPTPQFDSALPPFPPLANQAPTEGLGMDPNLSQIAGMGSVSQGKKTLLEKFKALPRRTQILVVIVGLFGVNFLMEEDPAPKPDKTKKVSKVVSPSASPSSSDKNKLSFDSLSREQKKFVESQHALAFEYYKNREYDKAIFEITKIFSLVEDYKDSREIERYSREGKRKIEAIEEEKRKKDEEAKLKAKVASLLENAKELMAAKKYKEATESFSDILAIEPDNPLVSAWKKQIEDYEEGERIKAQQAQVQKDVNDHAWGEYKIAINHKRARRYHSAIASFQSALDAGATDSKLLSLSKKQISVCKRAITSLREPLLAEGKSAEENKDYANAFKFYQKAAKVDPPHPTAYAGMNRVGGVLHDAAKASYIEGILAESYSDFATAKKHFTECLNTAPPEDEYHARAERKLSHYRIQEVDQ